MSEDASNWITVTPELAKNDPNVRGRLQIALGNIGDMKRNRPDQMSALVTAENYYKNILNPGQAAAPATPTALTAPVKGSGSNWTWQQDQQYWRDMDAYRKAQQGIK
jgi:hypothetical protein